MNRFRTIASVAAVALALTAGAAQSTTYTYNFASATGNLGSSESYTNNGVTVTAYGFSSNFTPTTLWGKNDAGNEKGLGLDIGFSNEIDNDDFVQLSLASLWAQVPNTVSIGFGSVQSGQSWKLYGSNTFGLLGTLLTSGTADYPALVGLTPMPTGYAYLGVTAGSGEILLNSLSASNNGLPPLAGSVPEPTTAALLATGLLLGWSQRKKARKSK